GACAAGRTHAAHRRAHGFGRGRSRRTDPHPGVPAGPAATGLDCRPQPADRDALGHDRFATKDGPKIEPIRSHALCGDADHERWFERIVTRTSCAVRAILPGDRAMSDLNKCATELEALTSIIRDFEIDRTRYVLTPIHCNGRACGSAVSKRNHARRFAWAAARIARANKVNVQPTSPDWRRSAPN